MAILAEDHFPKRVEILNNTGPITVCSDSIPYIDYDEEERTLTILISGDCAITVKGVRDYYKIAGGSTY